MNAKMKRRMIAVSCVIIAVILVVVAIIGSNTAAQKLSISQAADGSHNGQKVQISGNVVPSSFSTEGSTLTFSLYDPNDNTTQLRVVYDGAASSTFGNDVTAICTGRIDDDGTLQCTELVTQCPSKYESGSEALSASSLLGYERDMTGTVVKIKGPIVRNSLNPAGEDFRFILGDAEGSTSLAVLFDGALSDDITDESTVVVTGYLNDAGSFTASDVALEG